MKQNNSRQTTKVMEHNVLPIRKRKIEEQFEHDIESKNSSNPDQSVSSSNKKKKSSAILNAALSLVDASDSKAKHKMKHEFEKFPETVRNRISQLHPLRNIVLISHLTLTLQFLLILANENIIKRETQRFSLLGGWSRSLFLRRF